MRLSENSCSKKNFWLEIILLTGITGFISALLCHNALSVYDFFDMSAFMDAGYRVYSGQAPYVDFYYSSGPIHLYLHAFFFKLFGFSKIAILAHLCIINAIVVVATYFLVRRFLTLVESILLTVLSAFCFYGPISHPWYDQNAFFWLILGVLLFELQISANDHESPIRLRRKAILTGFGCGVLVGLSFLTKTNIGLAGGVTFLIAFLTTTERFRSIVGYLVGILASLATVVLTLKSPLDYIYQAFFFFNLGSRFGDTFRFSLVLWYTPYPLLSGMGLGLAFLGGRKYLEKNVSRFVLFIGLVMTSIFSVWTGSMVLTANIPLLGIEAVYLFLLAQQLPEGSSGSVRYFVRKATRYVLIGSALFWLLSAAEKTAAREAWTWHPSTQANDYILQAEALRGWRCNRNIGEGVDKIVEYINSQVSEEESLFVFPDATILYGLTGRKSYKKAPFFFYLNQVPAPGPLYDEFRGHFLSLPPRWIVLHKQDDFDLLDTQKLLRWLQLDTFIATNYRVVWSWGDFTLLNLTTTEDYR
jgi:hypothetical protein